AQGGGPVDRHGHHRLGLRRPMVTEDAIADDREALVQLADLDADVGGRERDAAGRVKATRDEHLPARLGEAVVEGALPKGCAHRGPEAELVEELAGRVEGEGE